MECADKSPSASVQSLQTDSETTSVTASETSSDSTLTSAAAKPSSSDTPPPHPGTHTPEDEANLLIVGPRDSNRLSTASPATHSLPHTLSASSTHTSVPCITIPPAPDDYIYNLKWIHFKGKSCPIVTQNENGPCPIIAIANVLLLYGKIALPPRTILLTGHRLVALLSDLLLAQPVPTSDDGQLLNYETAVSDAFNLFPSLQTGLDINVRFTAVSAFEFTSALSIFDLFKISIFHGWLIDPSDIRLASAVADLSYNQLVEQVIHLKQSKDADDVNRGLLMQDFLDNTASQLTYHGLCELCSALSDDHLAVFFRNNHYSTVYKNEGRVYLLVTDMGLLNEPKIVWEALVDVDGNTQFVDSSFRLYTNNEVVVMCENTSHLSSSNSLTNLYRSPPPTKPEGLKQSPSVEELVKVCTNLSNVPIDSTLEDDDDERMAARLQLEEIRAAENQKSSNSFPTSHSSYGTAVFDHRQSPERIPSGPRSKSTVGLENSTRRKSPIETPQYEHVIPQRSTLPRAGSDVPTRTHNPHNSARHSSHNECNLL